MIQINVDAALLNLKIPPFTDINTITNTLQCWNDFAFIDSQQQEQFPIYFKHPEVQLADSPVNVSANYLR